VVEPRLVTVRRPGVEVGVMLCGGNLRGVYIESVDEDSPARGPNGLLAGDLILEVWTITARTHTRMLGKTRLVFFLFLFSIFIINGLQSI